MAIVYLWADRSEHPIPSNSNVWLFDRMFGDVTPYRTGDDTSCIDGDYTHWMRINPQFIPVHPAPENTYWPSAIRQRARASVREAMSQTIRKLRGKATTASGGPRDG